MDKLLEPAVACRIATGAEERVGPQKQLELHAATLDQFWGVRGHFHPVTGGIKAGRHGTSATSGGDLHDAETTCPIWHETLIVTEGRDPNSCFLSGLQNGRTALNSNFNAVNGQGNHRNLLTKMIMNLFIAAKAEMPSLL